MHFGLALIIIVSLVALIWIVIELKRFKHKIFAIFLIALILFAYVSLTIVFKGKDVDYKTVEGVKVASGIYFSWLGGVFGNLKSITTNAVNMNWGANNTSPKQIEKK